jgi:hypothetical protein
VAWIGRQLTLFCDREVKWGGQNVGGIRISHMSHIDEPKTMMLSESKGKRKPVTVYPLEAVQALTLLDEWRPKFAGAPDDVMSIAKAIAAAWTERDSEQIVNPWTVEDVAPGWFNAVDMFRQAVLTDIHGA